MSFYQAVRTIYKNKRKELSRYQMVYSQSKEASLTASGSLTVESALVLPFVLMILMSFLFLFYVMRFQLELQGAMDHAVQRASAYYYAAELADGRETETEKMNGADGITKDLLRGGITEAYLRAEILIQMKDKSFERAFVWGKKAGLSFLQSEFPDEDGMIDLVVSYRIKIPFLPGEKASLFMSQRSRRKAWTGSVRWSSQEDEDAQEEDVIVYVTEHGSVYHRELTCSHLRLNISSVRPDEIAQLRNISGGKYYQCEKCQDVIAGFYLYITESGDRWHTKLQCSGLTRNIKQIKQSEVGARPPCSRCGGGE